MDPTNPYSETSNFVDLLTSQEGFVFPQPSQSQVFVYDTATIDEDTQSERCSRKKWTLTEDLVLISGWLNTSKDPVVGNEQKANAFWKRIAAYFAASPKVQGGEKRESIQCKQRWQKINDIVSKFSGSYEAAKRQKASGMNESDVLKLAHEIFHNDYKIKFNLQHAWEALRYDQKWCELVVSRSEGGSKKRRCDDGAQSSGSCAPTNDGETRPPGIKAAKRGTGKRTYEDTKDLAEVQTLCATKEKVSKMGLLETLIAKTEPLSAPEEALKSKLLSEMLGQSV